MKRRKALSLVRVLVMPLDGLRKTERVELVL